MNMKKIYLVICAALVTLSTVKAEVLLKESFGQATETLATNEDALPYAGEIAEYGGWTRLWGSGDIYMSSTNLSYAGYKTVADATGGSAEYKTTFAKRVASRFSKAVNSGSVYMAGIVKISSIKSSGKDYLWGLGVGTSALNQASSKVYARPYVYQSGSGFKFGIAKLDETSTATYIDYTETEYAYGTYLLVVEYQFVDGDKNDVIKLYVNPTKGDKPAEATCAPKPTQASNKNDASSFGSVVLQSSNASQAACLIDELKVVTDWADLWESGDTPTPEEEVIVTDDAVTIGDETLGTFSYKTYTKELEVLTEHLTQAVSITHTSSILELSTLTLPKEGGKLTLTLTQPQNEGYAFDTITFTSGKATSKTIVTWYNTIVNAYSTLAALKAAYASDNEYGLYAYTGEGIVTRVIDNNTYYTYYLQDESAAILLSDEWTQASEYFEAGDKITDFYGNAGEYSSYTGTRPLIMGSDVTIVSHNNAVTPITVTLEALQTSPATYLLEVIKVEEVSLDQKGEVFKAGSNVNITQGTYNANIQPISSSADYIGERIPAKADVVGFSTNISGTTIVPRDKKDIISKDSPSGTEEIFTSKKATKMVRDGQMIIVKDGKVFDVLGKELKN